MELLGSKVESSYLSARLAPERNVKGSGALPACRIPCCLLCCPHVSSSSPLLSVRAQSTAGRRCPCPRTRSAHVQRAALVQYTLPLLLTFFLNPTPPGEGDTDGEGREGPGHRSEGALTPPAASPRAPSCGAHPNHPTEAPQPLLSPPRCSPAAGSAPRPLPAPGRYVRGGAAGSRSLHAGAFPSPHPAPPPPAGTHLSVPAAPGSPCAGGAMPALPGAPSAGRPPPRGRAPAAAGRGSAAHMEPGCRRRGRGRGARTRDGGGGRR